MNDDMIAVTLLTTDSSVNLPMTPLQIGDLATMLRTESDPIPVHTLKAMHEVVGMLVQSKSNADFPKIILTKDVGEE